MGKSDLSVVVPVYNEEPENLDLLIERLDVVIRPMLLFYEIVFVDDGSESRTKKYLRELAGKFSYIKVVSLSRNFGEQAAICAGLDNAEGEVVINMDSDLQDPPELIPAMMQYWREGYDIVYTKQADRKENWLRQLQAKIFYWLLDTVSYIRIPRDAGEFRLMSRRAVDALRGLPENQRFLRGMVPWIGFKSVVLPFNRDSRKIGESAYTMSKLLALAVHGLMSFSIIPLLVTPILYVIVASILLGWLALNVLVVKAQIDSQFVLAACLIMGILQANCFIFIGIYLTQILSESKHRPVYIVQDVYKSEFESNDEQFGAVKSITKFG